MCEQVKALDIAVRNAEFEEKAPDNLIHEVFDILYGIIEIELNLLDLFTFFDSTLTCPNISYNVPTVHARSPCYCNTFSYLES